ncbi:peptidyl-prolyl cis-trans isomerase FKBP16-1, chloroplastic-like [Wolffia australiana]
MEICSNAGARCYFRSCSTNPRREVETDKLLLGYVSEAHYGLKTKRGLMAKSVILGTTASFILPVLSATAIDPYPENVGAQVQKLNSGVKFQEIVEGKGVEAHEGDVVEFNYVCRRSTGYFIHSTVDQLSGKSQPVILHLDDGKIIQGLKEVMVGMKAGGKRRALIPPSAGYISESLQPMPEEFGHRRRILSHANEPLVFEIQLLKLLNVPSQ